MDLNPQVQSALVGAVVAGLFAIAVGCLAHRREERRRKQEQQQREAEWFREKQQREAEWFREKLLQAYSGCLYYLLRLGISAINRAATTDPGVLQDLAESLRYLLILQAYNPPHVECLRECHTKLWDEYKQKAPLAIAADNAAIEVKKNLENDQRIKAPIASVQKT